jgi:DNA invertase Pin-like site-specific DNA recombinase
VSTKEQVEEGNSLSTQEKICREYCLKNEYEITRVFIEQGESAKTAERTELQKLLRFCADKKNGVEAVIIYKLDRLSRNTDDYSQLRILLKSKGVEIKSTSEYFANTPVGRFMENTMSNIAQFDNDIRTERSTNGMRDATRDGRYVWMAPIGYDNIKIGGRSTIMKNKKMAPLIKKTFELLATSHHSMEDVRQIVMKEGLVNRKGKPITKGYFYHFIRNELYAGWIIKFGEKHKGTFEPIVSEEIFNLVQHVIKTKGRKHSLHITDRPEFPLRRFIINEQGRKLTGSYSKGNGGTYPFYRFGGNGSNHRKEKFETLFKAYVDEYSFNDEKLKKLKVLVKKHVINKTRDKEKETERILKYIKELNEKQSGIIKKNLDGIIPDTVLKQQLAIIENELFEANRLLAISPPRNINFKESFKLVDEFLRNPSKVWEKAKLPVKLQLQWFQFPSGLVFENNSFGTSEK